MALATPKTAAKTEAVTEQEEALTQEGTQAAAAEPEQQTQAEPEVTEQEEITEEVQEAEAPAAEPAAEPVSEQKAVATAEPATPPASRHTSGIAAYQQEMEEEGLAGLHIGGMSFDSIRLPGEGQFLIGQDDEELGKSFDCVIQQTRDRYVVRQSDDQDAEMFYSYDPLCAKKIKSWEDLRGVTNAEGEDMTETLEEWAEEGYEKPVAKQYLEVLALFIDPENDERHGMMVILSISPSSVQRFSGFLMQQRMMKKKKHNEFITRCEVGKKIKKGNNNWFPWVFKNAGPVPEEFA